MKQFLDLRPLIVLIFFSSHSMFQFQISTLFLFFNHRKVLFLNNIQPIRTMSKNMEIPTPKSLPLKNIKQRKLGIAKQSSSQSPQLQQTQQFTISTTSNTTTMHKNSIPIDNLEYLQHITNRLLFDLEKDSKNKRSNLEKTLPPLTSSNDLDVKLYALFSLLLNSFVYGWYQSSLDLGNKNEFTKELIFIFAHICRNLQERINNSKDELVKLLIIDLPYLLTEHFENIDEVTCILAKDGSKSISEIQPDDVFINEWMMRYSDRLANEETYLTYRRFVVKSIVCLILPHENIESNISREFLVSLLDGIVLKNIIDSFCDSFVLWELIGKLSSKLTNSKDVSKSSKPTTRKKSTIHNILEFFIVEERYEMKPDEMLNFSDFIPLFSFVNLLTMIDLRFPILVSIIQVIFQLMLKVNFINIFVNNSIKRAIFDGLLNESNVETGVDFLRHMMFPDDDRFEMKPRYVPQNDEELKVMYDDNLKLLRTFLSSNSKTSGVFISKEDGNNENTVDAKARYIFSVFKNRQVNQVLIRKIIDLLLSKIFPELQNQDMIGSYKIHD